MWGYIKGDWMKNFGKNLRHLIKNMDKPLLILTLGLFIFGLLNILTASSREAVIRYNVSMYFYFFRQLQMIIFGLFGAYVLLNLRTKAYVSLIKPAYLFVFVMVILLFFMGVEVHGVVRWVPIPILGNIQPSEFAKPIIIIFLAVLFERFYRLFRSPNAKTRNEKIGVILFIGCFIPVIVFLQGDLGTSLIMLIIFGVMFLLSPIKRMDKLLTIMLMVGLLIVAAAGLFLTQGRILQDYQLRRFDFINPCANYETTGYQTCNGFIALNDGGLFGLGIGRSRQKYSYIPEPHTDSVFAIIGEEYGLLRSSLIFIAYIVILFRILKIAVVANTMRGRYICLGVATYIFAHIFINLGGLFAVIPLTGVPLPFLSYGGSFAISLLCSLAVVQRVHIENKTQKIKV